MRKFNKIFNPHLGKSGTSSLTEALKILGLKGFHYRLSENITISDIIKKNQNQKNIFQRYIDHFDFLSDFGLSVDLNFIKLIDDQYPNSLFILCTRELNSWLSSINKQTKVNSQNSIYKGNWITYNKQRETDLYCSIHEFYSEYFFSRSDMLILPLEHNNKWKLICDFLECEKPSVEYPHINITPEPQIQKPL